MKRLVQLLEQKMTLIVSLPANSVDLFRAAVEGGADAVKIHFNVEHRASGTHFGPLEQYADEVAAMTGSFAGPIGAVAGGSMESVTREGIDRLRAAGFDFVSLYAHHAPAWLLTSEGVSRMIAVDGRYAEREIAAYRTLPIDILEASIVPSGEYGARLSVKDLLAYRSLVERSGKPVVVPSQRLIGADDLAALQSTGVRGVMIGAIVTGSEASSIYEATRQFRRSLDALAG